MNRPLALIEGDLALPIPRPFESLPPPFGTRRRQTQRDPRPVALTGAQQAMQNAVQRSAPPARGVQLPPGVKFLFLYKLPQQRDYSQQFKEQLAEARHYLEMGRVRPSSTRSDHILGAMIFAGCSIALAWLLATCTTHDTSKTTVAATPVTRPAASLNESVTAIHPQDRADQAQPLIDSAGTITRSAPLTAGTPPKMTAPVTPTPPKQTALGVPTPPKETAPAVTTPPKATAPAVPTPPNAIPGTSAGSAPQSQNAEHVVPRPTGNLPKRQIASIEPSKARHPKPSTRLSNPQVDEHLALGRPTRLATKPSAPKQSGLVEWTKQPLSTIDTAERATWRDWGTQPGRASITTRASTPTPGDTDWNARMTQRRVTDSPDAFQADRVQK